MTDPVPVRPDGLQLDEHRAFQQRFWTLQRVAWASYLLVIVIAVAGLTGRGGPFAIGHALIGKAEVTWPRITRRGVPETLTILFAAPATAPELTLGPEITRLFQIETILPRPAMESGGAPLRFAFFPDPGPRYGVTLSLRAQGAGFARYEIGAGGETVTVTTLVLP